MSTKHNRTSGVAGLRWTAAILAVSAVSFAIPAAAVDGQILINQAAANTGGITPGDAAGFPVTISRSGHYKLSGNLKVPATRDGIEVTVSDVTIDLNGFTISGTPTSGFGIVSPGDNERLRVIDGTISGFNVAAIDIGALAVIENMRLVSNGYGVIAKDSSRILNSTIVNNVTRGIECFSACSIEGTIVSSTGNTGIFIPAGGALVVGNVIVGNGGFGISSSGEPTGYGQNILIGNTNGQAQVFGSSQLHPNVCDPACP